MEISLINSISIKARPRWTKVLREKAKELDRINGGGKKLDTIMVVLNKDEKFKSVDNAWRELCRNEFHKEPLIETEHHQLGITMYLRRK